MTKTGNLHLFPSLVCVIAPLTFVVTFAIAAKLGHVYIFLPYISDTGNLMPESCIFSQFLNITAFLMLICVYIRYLQIKAMATFKSPIGHRLNANEISWYTGFTSVIGMSVVANFQVQHIYQVHYAGALMLFVGGSIYFVFQTIFSYHISKVEDSKYLFYIRCSLCILSGVLCTSAIVNGAISFDYQTQPRVTDVWYDLTYIAYITSTSSEWLLTLTFNILVLTFLPEFKRITIGSPKIEIQGIHDTIGNICEEPE